MLRLYVISSINSFHLRLLTKTTNPSSTISTRSSSAPVRPPPSVQAADALSVLQHAKCILGFSPVTCIDISYLKSKHATPDDSIAMTHSIIEFLNREMKVPSLTTLRVEDIWLGHCSILLSSLPPLQLSPFDRNLSSSPPPHQVGSDSPARGSVKVLKQTPQIVSTKPNLSMLLILTLILNPVLLTLLRRNLQLQPRLPAVQKDGGALPPSACLSPSVATNKNFVFWVKSSIPRPNLNC